jgi:hypothetical protein
MPLGAPSSHSSEVTLEDILNKHLQETGIDVLVLWENIEHLGNIHWPKYESLKDKPIFINDKTWRDLLRAQGFNAQRYYPGADIWSAFRFTEQSIKANSIKYKFNRMANTTHDHSYAIHKFLYENDMLKDTLWSYGFNITNPNRNRYLDEDYVDLPVKLLEGDTWHNKMRKFELNYFLQAGFIINNETVYHGHGPSYSEKLVKAIGCCRPFIEVSAPHTLRDLHELGFQTFPDIIDESYDSIEDPYDRMDAIQEQIKKIHKLSLTEIKDYIIHNEKKFYSNYKVMKRLYKETKKLNYKALIIQS